MLQIDDLRMLCTDETIFLTQHLQLRMRERGILYDDVVNAIMTGEVIEQYSADYPYPSCLILGTTLKGSHIHVVCGIGNCLLWVITTYYPSSDKWEADSKTRKEHTQL